MLCYVIICYVVALLLLVCLGVSEREKIYRWARALTCSTTPLPFFLRNFITKSLFLLHDKPRSNITTCVFFKYIMHVCVKVSNRYKQVNFFHHYEHLHFLFNKDTTSQVSWKGASSCFLYCLLTTMLTYITMNPLIRQDDKIIKLCCLLHA